MHSSPTHSSLPTPGGGSKSFWHTSPSRILLNHRTTPALPKSTDTIIIGSGIAGAFASWNLFHTAGVSPSPSSLLLLEAREACWGATGRNGGHCQPKLYTQTSRLARFELSNLKYLRKFVQEHEVECEWRDVAACHGFFDDEMFFPAVAAVEALKALDPELGAGVSVVTEKAGREWEELRLGRGAVGAVVSSWAATLWPYRLVAWVLECLIERYGGEERRFNLQTNTPVLKLQKMEGGGWIVHTERGMVAAKQVLLCTNAYTSFLLPAFDQLIVPVKGEVTALRAPESVRPGIGTGVPLGGRHSYCFYGSAKKQGIEKDDYLTQRPFTTSSSRGEEGGQLMIGGGRDFAVGFGVGVSDDSFVETKPVEYLRGAIAQDMDLGTEEKEKLEAEWAWSGIMGFSRDWHPWIGGVPEKIGGGEGLFVCAGFSGHGMPNASLCAKAVVKMMRGENLEEEELPEEFVVRIERVRKETSR